MITNYLLQHLEVYRGVSILTSNLLNNLNDTLLRRVKLEVEFDELTEWQQSLGQRVID